ncbi:chemotaxis protein CheW [Bacillus sp. T33-2]|uniref:chemotaxis protein CheW n=1 Tax=Bacillus sp. T33-2 TaxID=2054168 RepID=UPI000C77765D|nr:chemotaxis protein CheW [Bacillus sp. T33-2]PLR99847.1 chemotaxis protein CheW [Bacillus sp. T33-2]
MADRNKVVVFQAGNEEYAFPILHVISIEKIEQVTPIPHMPASVKGIIQVRGELVPVIDLEHVLYNQGIVNGDKTRMIVLKTDELSYGVLVSDAREILDIPSESMKQLGLIAYQKTAYITGVASFDGRMIMVIDPEKLIQSVEGIKEIQDYMRSQHQSQ